MLDAFVSVLFGQLKPILVGMFTEWSSRTFFCRLEVDKRNKRPKGVKKGVVYFQSCSLKPLDQLEPNFRLEKTNDNDIIVLSIMSHVLI